MDAIWESKSGKWLLQREENGRVSLFDGKRYWNVYTPHTPLMLDHGLLRGRWYYVGVQDCGLTNNGTCFPSFFYLRIPKYVSRAITRSLKS